eukprot:TRINITY_DN10510_c0_g1_i2.p1 TRINITY_DN10510_c0_g1~~TRINITY_DN10510_c0_g1_i2.p1  ORF type:complete len:133 (+),score=21.73 TRINITY_DN10510_c0_g1_i2:38-436(+)
MPAPYADDNDGHDEEPPDTARVHQGEGSFACGRISCFMILGIPSVVTLFSVLFGAIIAGIEDTSFENGFWVAATILTTSSSPLGDNTTLPATDGGKFFSIICGTWAMGLFGIFVVLMSAPAMDSVYALLRLR